MYVRLLHCFKFSQNRHTFDPSKNYYDILKIKFGCSKGVIRVSYLGLCKKYHPDVNPKGKQHFTLIQEAYQVLSDEKQKKEYDQFYSNHFGIPRKNANPGTNSKANNSNQHSYQQKYKYDKSSEDFKGQKMYKQMKNQNNQQVDLKKQRQEWTKQYYEMFGVKKQQLKPKSRPRTSLDQQYQKLQYSFSNKNPFSYVFKQQEENKNFYQLWQSFKNKIKK